MTRSKVLIVDDSRFIVHRLTVMLEEIATIQHVFTAGTYAEGDKLINEVNPHIVLLDINLPDNTGVELLRTIRKKDKAVKIIMITNQVNDHYRRTCGMLGANYFVDKSNEFDIIPDIISQIQSSELLQLQ